ncbi:MAG TPA: ATP-dependent DNA helicase RecG [Alphaproteobacteria bacterium]|nr:ATP-dependent DNA helicase RecG [Alphaproteobacteria bacterium]
MRPPILYPLFAPVTSLPGIGPRIGKLIERLAGPFLVDLLWHLPTGIIDRSYRPKLSDAEPGRIVTLQVRIEKHLPGGTPRLPYRIRAKDETGVLELVYFHARGDYLKRLLPVGGLRVISGRLDRFQGMLQIAHPDYALPLEQAANLPAVEPVYPLASGIQPKTLAKAIQAALARTPGLPEWIDPTLIRREAWPSWKEALTTAHAPRSDADLLPNGPARRRLAYDELLANQLAVALVRLKQRKLPGPALTGDGRLRRKALAALPFALTRSQEQAIAEIVADMAAPERMLRLLQGDVGSGKTLVALIAMLTAVEAGAQAAIMAPTEILARQHHTTIEPLARAAGVPLALLTGRERGRSRDEILTGLADGSLPLAVGTHALVQEGVAFRDLGLAVIDEQHRFGVEQRLELARKGRGAHTLVMTATPIPRTLMLTAYGDLDVSRLTEKPAGRKPVDTRVLPVERLEEVVAAVRRAIARGAKIFWICPLVEESEAIDVAAAEDRHRHLAALFGDRVGIVHGRMKGLDKDRVMARFTRSDIDILVATTVIEVGVDVPDATVMVIEHAERFGLAQLHQLRGRIGRGDKPGTCLLVYQGPLGETAKARLKILRETEDGFRIAEEDLQLRGAGELLGTKQSGLPDFRLASLVDHQDLLQIARDEARLLLRSDPEFAGERGAAVRILLYLFERDAAVRTARSG